MRTNSRISAEIFISLTNVFRDNGWDITIDSDGFESRFNRFCERLSMFEYEEQKLIIELTKRFTVINSTDYLGVIDKLLNENNDIQRGSIKDANKLFIYPLIAPNDMAKTKSSKFVWYFLHDEQIKFNKVFINKNLLFCEIEKLSWAKNLKQFEKILLVDDYIGSGETAENAINWIIQEHGIDVSNIIVLSLAAQDIGLQRLNKLGVEVYTYYRFKRGISDYYEKDDLENKLLLMKGIESKLKVEEKYKFGYNNSEALVSLTRAPNNTFPVFWKPNGKNKIVPFPRD